MSRPLEIVRPTLVLDEAKVRCNIERMVEKARHAQVVLRPHCKTHQSAAIAEWFRDAGIDRITVSSLDMAAYFATHGWRDITVAFPCNVMQIDLADRLASQVDLGIVVDSVDTVAILAERLTHPVRVWIKIDVGYGRAGVHWADMDSIENVVRRLQATSTLRMTGVLTHAGHSYAAHSHEQLQEISQSSLHRLRSVASVVQDHTETRCLLSVGDTPTLSLDEVLGVDEIRPGNFVFHDVMQLTLGSCGVEDIAVAVACPVVARYPHRREVLLYGGAAHLSKEVLQPPATERLPGLAGKQAQVFGVVVDAPQDGSGWGGSIRPDAVLTRVSQEHGILDVDGSFWDACGIGSPVYLLPVHSCLTADLYPAYMSLSGKQLERCRSNDRVTGQPDGVV
jgi:D-serine deaminase-like pyridoxal phosphate-dependent protein